MTLSQSFESRWRLGLIAGLLVLFCFKLWLILQQPIAVFTSDSHTYLRTAKFFWLHDWHISIHPKRAFLYPVLLTLLHPLPGGLGLWVIVLQQLISLVIPLLIVKLLRDWFPAGWWLAFPAVLLSGMSVPLLYFGHYLIADCLYAVAFWWYAWRSWRFLKHPDVTRVGWMFAAAALAFSLRPDAKILVLNTLLLLGLVISGLLQHSLFDWNAWRKRGLFVLLPVAFCALLWVGNRVTQEGWLLYSRVFPLTVLDSSLHAEYKAELQPWVLNARKDLVEYPGKEESSIQHRLGHRSGGSIGPLWDDLKKGGQNKRHHRICRDLAMEAIVKNPVEAVKLTFYRVRYVFAKTRDRWRDSRSFAVLRDLRELMIEEPEYAPMLFDSSQAWEQVSNRILDDRDDEPHVILFKHLERVTSPEWWSWVGLASLLGWILAMVTVGRKMVLWWLLFPVQILVTYAIARSIPRYLLPAEPLLVFGWLAGLGALASLWKSYRDHQSSTAPAGTGMD